MPRPGSSLRRDALYIATGGRWVIWAFSRMSVVARPTYKLACSMYHIAGGRGGNRRNQCDSRRERAQATGGQRAAIRSDDSLILSNRGSSEKSTTQPTKDPASTNSIRSARRRLGAIQQYKEGIHLGRAKGTQAAAALRDLSWQMREYLPPEDIEGLDAYICVFAERTRSAGSFNYRLTKAGRMAVGRYLGH